MYKYSILMYNFNNYEIMRTPKRVDPNCEYIYVTDNTNLTSSVWKIIVDKDIFGMSAFDKCYHVRFNPFKYCSTDTCVYLDGSVQINNAIDPIVHKFASSNKDLAVIVHPNRNTMIDEYHAWVTARHYPESQAFKCLHEMEYNGYDINSYKGLYQGNMRICKNTPRNNQLESECLSLLKTLGTNGVIERLDQTIYSYLLNTRFSDISIYPMSQQVVQSQYMTWCGHGTHAPHPFNKNNYDPQYVRNKLTRLETI